MNEICTVPVIPFPNSSTSLPVSIVGLLGSCNTALGVTFIVRLDFIITGVRSSIVASLARYSSFSS